MTSDKTATNENSASGGENSASGETPAHKEPSMGPACLVVTILALAGSVALCGLGSWLIFRDQAALATKSIQKQLIPWVEGSQLSPNDKQSIVEQLDALVVEIELGKINKQQLSRLHNCLQDNPVILWGGIQSIESQAAAAGLTETEIESLKRTNQRLLRMATERKMGRTDLEYTIQQLSKVNKLGDTLEVNSDLTGEQIQIYMKRAETLLTRSKIPNEPYEKTPAEAFGILLKAALEVPK